MIATAWPRFEPDELDAALDVLRSGRVNYWTGEEGRRFEAEFAAYCGVPHAIALANGTVALELALRAAGIGPGDEVVVTPRSFMASVSCVVAVGALPVFADVDRESQSLTAHTIARVLTSRTRAIVAVHLAGWPCDMDPIMQLAAEEALLVVEDCAQAHGATYRGRRVGSLGHAAAFSFCQDKILTTAGEGGMLVTSDPDLWQRAWSYKDHGKSHAAVHRRDHPPGFRWLHASFGTNWRLSEVQAAVGRRQLAKLDGWVEARRRNTTILDRALAVFDCVRRTIPPLEIGHARYRYYTFVRPERLAPGWSRDRIVAELTARGFPAFVGSCPEIYREQAFAAPKLGPHERLPIARELGETSIAFLVDHTLDADAMERAASLLRQVLTEASAASVQVRRVG